MFIAPMLIAPTSAEGAPLFIATRAPRPAAR